MVQAQHANGEHSWGVNEETGKIVDMKTYGLYESARVEVRSISFLLGHILTVGALLFRFKPSNGHRGAL